MLHIVVASGNANTTNASPSVVPSYFEPHMSHHKRTVCPAKDVTKYLNKEETKNQCRIFQCRILSFFFFFSSPKYGAAEGEEQRESNNDSCHSALKHFSEASTGNKVLCNIRLFPSSSRILQFLCRNSICMC